MFHSLNQKLPKPTPRKSFLLFTYYPNYECRQVVPSLLSSIVTLSSFNLSRIWSDNAHNFCFLTSARTSISRSMKMFDPSILSFQYFFDLLPQIWHFQNFGKGFNPVFDTGIIKVGILVGDDLN